MDGALTLDVGGGRVTLLPERAAWLAGPRLLLVADAHLGKAQAYRKLGVPVPAGTTAENLRRLGVLIEWTRPRELVFLGDLLHAPHGRSPQTMAAVARWRATHASLPMRLVRGNHDARAGDPPAQWDIVVVDEPWRVDHWALCHHPQAVAGAYVLAGHEHPCITLGAGIDRLRLPCFHLGARSGVLPAFGEFTGAHPIRRRAGDRVAVVVGNDVRLLAG